MRTYPPGSRFLPTELGLVKLHLKNKLEKNISGFIKTLNVYVDAPWRLDHDTNHLYPRNEWYYFVPRTIRGKKTVSRIVPSNGESLGGTWKSIGKKQEVKNSQEVLMGYKNELVFNKNVEVDGKSKQEKTDWHMDEYSLNREGKEFHDLILCHIRLLHSAERFKPVVPPAHHQVVEYNDNNNNVLQNQDQQQVAGFANHNDMVMVETNQQQQQQQEPQDSLNLQHPPFQSNDNLEHYPLEDTAYHGAEDDMTTGYGLMQTFNQGNVVNQQQQQHEQQQDSPALPLQTNNNIEQQCPFAYHGAEDDDMTSGYGGLMEIFNQGKVVNQRQQHEQQQQDSTALPLQTNSNIEQQCPFAYQGMTSGYDGLMQIFNQGNVVNQQQQQQQHEQQQQDSPALPLQTNVNLMEDIAYLAGAYADLASFDHDELGIPIPNDNQEQHPSCDTFLVPSHQVENNNNNNTTVVLPNQDQQESVGFANQQHEQQEQKQQESLTYQHPLFQNNHNQEHYPLEDIAFDVADDNDTSDFDNILWKFQNQFDDDDDVNDNHGLVEK